MPAQVVFYTLVCLILFVICYVMIGIQFKLDEIGRIADIMEARLRAEGGSEVPTKKKLKKDKEEKKED